MTISDIDKEVYKGEVPPEHALKFSRSENSVPSDDGTLLKLRQLRDPDGLSWVDLVGIFDDFKIGFYDEWIF